jgi:asparagine synthase (glutamine-hydrolysing)
MSGYIGIVDWEHTGAENRVIERQDRSLPELLMRAVRDANGGVCQAAPAMVAGQPLGTDGLARVEVAEAPSVRYVFAGDIRLDNRCDLQHALGNRVRHLGKLRYYVGACSAQGVQDMSEEGEAPLVMAAYQKWGPECPEKLLGDFSFALWDEAARRLVCARDHAGVRPLFYYANKARIVFASSLRALLRVRRAASVDHARIGDFLAGIDPSASATFYDGVKRLPPAHGLVATPDGIQVHQYWAPEPTAPGASRSHRRDKAEGAAREAPSDDEHVEAFRETFSRAVQCRIPEAGGVGTFLSGGLDSTSIAATAHDLRDAGRPVQTFSAVYDRLASCDERPYIRRVLRRGRFASHFVLGEEQKPLSALEQLLAVHAEPFFAPNMGVSRLLYDAARTAGVTTVLHGHGGDEVVSQGYGRLKELARAGRWMTLAREVRGVAQISGSTAWPVLLGRYVERYGIQPAADRHLWGRLLRKAVHLVRHRLLPPQTEAAGAMRWTEWVNPDFARAVGLEARVDAARRTDPRAAASESERHRRLLAGTQQALALETLARTGRAHGVDTTFPFWDKRLVELCLSLPGDLKLRDGWGRYVLRLAMEDRLPPSVRWRRDKTDFFPNLIHGLQREKERLDHLFLDCGEVAEEYLQMAALRDIHARFTSDPTACDARDVFRLWKAVVLIAWLRQAA